MVHTLRLRLSRYTGRHSTVPLVTVYSKAIASDLYSPPSCLTTSCRALKATQIHNLTVSILSSRYIIIDRPEAGVQIVRMLIDSLNQVEAQGLLQSGWL